MWQDKRSGKIVLVAHCILNQNSRVFGLAQCPGMIHEIINVLKNNEIGVIQMPCPELTYAGLNRSTCTKKQYDVPFFRRYCRETAIFLTDQIQQYLKNGFKVLAILGVEGSPSCGVRETATKCKEETINEYAEQTVEPEKVSGIFMEELQSALAKRNISIPMVGIKYARIEEDITQLEKILRGTE